MNEHRDNALQSLYPDWLNNYAQVVTMAEHYGLEAAALGRLIAAGRVIHQRRTDRSQEVLENES